MTLPSDIAENLKLLKQMMGDVQSAARAPAGSNKRERKERFARIIAGTDPEALFELRDKVDSMISQISSNEIDASRSLRTAEELDALMREEIEQREIKELLEARYEMRRAAVFDHITQVNADNGVADPEFAPGEIAVPEREMKFSRRGGKPKTGLDQGRLAALLGDRASKVFRSVVVPEHVETEFDEDALMELVASDPGVLELVRDCIVVQGRTPVSFHIETL